jgi:hypothetical protein
MLSERNAAILTVALRFLFCCYRAHQQAISIDEAITYNTFVDGSWRTFFRAFDPNNHILHTVLARISCAVFGVSELSLRLPSLIAGAALLWLTFRILQRFSIPPIWRWFAFLAVALHPLLLDFSIAARGYSLSIAFLLLGFEFILLGHSRSAGISLGLAIASNLSAIFPAIALALTAPPLLGTRPKDVWLRFSQIAGWAAAVAVALCYMPLRSATRESFTTGYQSLRQALESYAYTSIHAKPDDPGFMGTRETARILVFWILPVVLLALTAVAARRAKDGHRAETLPLAATLLTAFGFLVANFLFQSPYPADRACLFFVPMLGFAWAAGFARIPSRFAQALSFGLAAVVVAQFATQLHGSYFQFWPGQIDDKKMISILARSTANCPASSITIHGSTAYLPTLEFYRKQHPLRALKPVELREYPELQGADFYALQYPDRAALGRSGLRILHENTLVDFVLASGSKQACLSGFLESYKAADKKTP